jgi:PAS domain-containing protein
LRILAMAIAISGRIDRNMQRSEVAAGEFSLLCDTFDAGTWHWDLRTNSFDWSAGEYALFGLNPSHPLVYESWRNTIHPLDHARVDAEPGRAIVGQADFHSVFRIERRNGQQTPTLH